MDNSGRRLGIALLTVVVMLGLNAFAVLSGFADSTYGSLFGYQPDSYLVATRADIAVAEPVTSAKECAQSRPKHPDARRLVAATGTRSDAVPTIRMC
jgi:hypothetical protein